MAAAYEAMATNVETLANTANWTDEEVNAGKNLFDGDAYKAISEKNATEM
jgi:hypothetical protein